VEENYYTVCVMKHYDSMILWY